MTDAPGTFTVRGAVWRVCAVLVALALAGCSSSPGDAPRSTADTIVAPVPTAGGAVTLSQDELRTGGIEVARAAVEAHVDELVAPAVLQVDETRTARIGAVADGVVIGAPAAIGVRVSRGAVLARIHSHDVHDAWAGYHRAIAERRQASSVLAFARDAEARTQRLLAAKAASRQETERAALDRSTAEEALVIAESEVRRAEEELEHLGIDAAHVATAEEPTAVPVLAPLDGVVLERAVTAGTAVTVGAPLFVVSDLSHLWAVAEVDETRLAHLRLQTTAPLTVVAHPGRVFDGRIVAVGEAINPETRRVAVRLAIDNADGALKPQMFASVGIPLGARRQVLVVPVEAVQKIEQQAGVFVQRAEGRFEWRAVTLGREADGRVEILDGLGRDEPIAVSRTFLLKTKLVDAGAES